MDEPEETPTGIVDTARQAGATVLNILHNRLELLLVEVQEDRLRLFEALLLMLAIAASAFFTLSLAMTGIIILTWAEFGVKGLFILSGVGLVGTAYLIWRLRAQLKCWALLSGTLAELKKDRECLENK